MNKGSIFQRQLFKNEGSLYCIIFSENIVNMIDDYAEEYSGKKYATLRELLLLLDDFINIMNGRENVHCFSSPNDKKLNELLNLFRFFGMGK